MTSLIQMAKTALTIFMLVLIGLYFLGTSAKAEQPKLEVVGYDIYKLVDSLAGPYDLSNTVKTLIYIESKNGLYPVNLQDPACGITHININTYIKRHKLKDTKFNRNKACSDLIADPAWAITNAIEELSFWKHIHCKRKVNGMPKCTVNQFKNVVKSYNTGWNYKGKAAEEYYEKFRKAYKEIIK